MKVLVIGSGGREHALAWRLAQDPEVSRVYASPGNPGMASLGQCVADSNSLDPDLIVVGPEAPLMDGVVDRYRAAGKRIVGPLAAAAQLEGSKAFAKKVMDEAGVPTARFLTAANQAEAEAALAKFSYPVVLKADGLAAGKGVVIVQSREEAIAAIPGLLALPGAQLVIEQFLLGEEVSYIVLTDGKNILPLAATQDHKRIGDGDTGPNTGGMGSYCDGRILTEEQSATICDTIIHPVLDYMQRSGKPYTGFLYAGLMMTPEGPKVLEFNVRLGDPETQTIMHRLKGSFAPVLTAAAEGNLQGAKLDWNPDPSVCVVCAAEGYPGKPRTGDPISGLADAASTGAVVFHAGTSQSGDQIVTAGGRVIGVTASGPDLPAAIRNAYAAVERIHFPGMQYRRDIAQKGLKRW